MMSSKSKRRTASVLFSGFQSGARGDADVALETAFLAYLDSKGIPVAAAVQTRGGSLFTSIVLPEGERPAVFVHARLIDLP